MRLVGLRRLGCAFAAAIPPERNQVAPPFSPVRPPSVSRREGCPWAGTDVTPGAGTQSPVEDGPFPSAGITSAGAFSSVP